VLGLGVVAVAVALAVWYGQRQSNEALRVRVEALGPTLAGVTLALDSVRRRGERVTLHGLTLKNPEGFRSAYALRIETLSLQLDPNVAGAESLRIAEVSAEGVQAIFETRGETSNLEEVLDRLESHPAESPAADAWTTAAVTLDELRAGPGRVRVELEDDARPRETEMPAIRLTLHEQRPAAAADLVGQALALVVRRAITAGAEVVLRDLVRATRPTGPDGLGRAADSVADELERSGSGVSP